MPEKFSRKIGDGFISVWEIEEPIGFFEHTVERQTLAVLQETHTHENRLRQKLVPHFILAGIDDRVQLFNLDRKPSASKGFISISHCKNTLALFYHPQRAVGIDIEQHGTKVLRIRHKFLSMPEQDFCGDDVTRCLVMWAAKEAIFKKYGNETAFFAENILIAPFDTSASFPLQANVRVNRASVSESLQCELNNGLVLVHTL